MKTYTSAAPVKTSRWQTGGSPIFLELPIRHKEIIHEPMLEAVNIRPWLKEYHSEIEMVSCGGE